MAGEEFDLEILDLILGQFSKDMYLLFVIENLLKSESSLSEPYKPDNKKTFASVKVLLRLYEKLHTSENESEKPNLPISVITENIKQVLNCSNENCKLPDNDIQCSISCIVSSLFKTATSQNSNENIEELTKLYSLILTSLHTTGECQSDCLIFKLKLMKSIYHALAFVPKNEFMERLKSRHDLDECEVFTHLILQPDNNLACQTLTYLIPEYINCFRSERVVEVTWKQVSNTAIHSSKEHMRVLIILCTFFDICLDKSKAVEKMDFTNLFLEDVKYWKIVQTALIETDPVKRKHGMFLLKKTVELLKDAEKFLVCNPGDVVFYWNSDCRYELYEIYSEIIICLEFLEEQQVHIIRPVLQKIETLGKTIVECDNVNSSWALLLYKKALMHESTQIVKWGLSNLLKLPVSFFSHEHIIREIVVSLVNTLNNMSIYYNNGLAVSRELNEFFGRIVELNSSKRFFSLFIKEICSLVWSAEALFFVIHSLSGVQRFSCWGEEEISEVGTFVSKAFKTHNKIIRAGVQCELLNGIISFTDTEHVSLECVLLLISKFSTEEVVESEGWSKFVNWLRNSYTMQQAEEVLERYKKTVTGENFNAKLFSLMLILFDFVFYSDSTVKNYFRDIVSSFKETQKRPYCDKLLYDRYLSVVCSVYEFDSDCTYELIQPTLPNIQYLVLYVHSRLLQISNLQDFNACKTYAKSFEVLLIRAMLPLDFQTPEEDFGTGEISNDSRSFSLLGLSSEMLKDMSATTIKDAEVCLSENSGIPPIGMFCRILLLSIMEWTHTDLSPLLLNYLFTRANEPLTKAGDESKQTRDLQTLWGKMNSEFIREKWQILANLVNHQLENGDGNCRIDNKSMVGLCLEALSGGGYGVLRPVMSVLSDLLPVLDIGSEVKGIVDSVWKLIMERRKTEEFKTLVESFVRFLYGEKFVRKGNSAGEILFEYADLLFSDSSTAVVNIFMKHIQAANTENYPAPLLCHIIAKGLLFGPVQKKDERLTNQVCQHIESLKICNVRKMGDYNICTEIRARAVQTTLKFNLESPDHRFVCKKLIDTLLKMEKEINKNRIRYFGNSHVHRVKLRLMQSLLILKPVLDPNEVQTKELTYWLYDSLMTENLQPSVRSLQEWLFVILLLMHSELYSRYCISNYSKDFGDGNKRSICSTISISYHVCKISPPPLLSKRIVTALDEIFTFCFHQQFEVRLYSQVVFRKLYDFANTNGLKAALDKFTFINMSLEKTLETHLKGNFGKNIEKMSEDFYFTVFHPVKHYSLETIYMDFPRLTNVDSDEWISTETFERCGMKVKKFGIRLQNDEPLMKYSSHNKWGAESSCEVTDLVENSEVTNLENYQKKIIPQKPLIPGWDENNTIVNNKIKEGGLIVVASLIDRLPNLGGLARTCEIFGASQYVMSSLKYAEDKQFTSLSVTAEKWIPLKEVKPQNLMEYITEMKEEGYTVIGAEQMLHSEPLGSVKFPKKTLLLLGNEKEGIPPNLLPLLDICIEIPQLGIIRSLNVHVTGAVFIWEYAKQNHFS